MKRPERKKVVPTIQNVSVFLKGDNKWGKTTLWRDLIRAKFHDDECGLLIECGLEGGESMLQGVNYVSAQSWVDILDVIHWLLNEEWIERNEKGKIVEKVPLEHNIKMVCLDGLNELLKMAEDYTIKKSNADPNRKKCDTIKGAMGGYSAGEAYKAQIIRKAIDQLKRKFGGVWGIAHAKFKSYKFKTTEEDGIMKLVSDLPDDYDRLFGDVFDISLAATIDRETEHYTDSSGKDRIREISAQRVMYLRGNAIVAAGGRFRDGTVPEKMIWDKPNMAPEFIRTIETGIAKTIELDELDAKKNQEAEISNSEIEIPDFGKENEPTPTEDVFPGEELSTEESLEVVESDNSIPDEIEPDLTIDQIKADIKVKLKDSSIDIAVRKEVSQELRAAGSSLTDEQIKDLYKKLIG